jgi:hypothetical protein
MNRKRKSEVNSKRYSYDDLIQNVTEESVDLDNEEETDGDENLENRENRKLYVDKVDKSTSDLFRMIKEKELNLQPDYQRKFVWDKKTMSKFIESLLLAIPIPTIFLAENNDDTFEVIDGQQRLTTIFAFMKTKLTENELSSLPEYLQETDVLTLLGLETLQQFNKHSYADLEDMQRKFNNVSLPVVIIKKDSTEDIKYDIFSRINSGSIKLNNQELLNVMYRGILLKTLNDLCVKEEVDNLFGNRPVLKKRYGYNEILLRAKVMSAYVDKDSWKLVEVNVKNKDQLDKISKKYNGRLNHAILDYLKDYRNDVEEAKILQAFIEDVIEKIDIVFGASGFKRVQNELSTKINKTIAELQMVVLSKFSKESIQLKKDEIKSSFFKFVADNDESLFIRGTNNTTNVEKRYVWGKIVSDIISGE